MSTPDGILPISPETTDTVEAWHVQPSRILSVQALAELNERSDRKGWQQLTAHLAIMAASGTIWTVEPGWIALPALVVYGFSLASMFATVHECVHRTAFASQRVNDSVAWLAGVLSFYNSTFYRRYHKWHHRYTQIAGKDPELEDEIPTNWRMYLWQMSGIPWWVGKIRGHRRAALGQFEGCPYISETAREEVMRSTRWQLAVYGAAIALSIAVGQPWFITYWLLPLAIGQPILRFILIAEHTGCPQIADPLANTRTTLTIWPLRLLMWNMPFHGEHHLYASIPFHALPKAHEQLADRLTQVAPGYVAVNRQLTTQFGSVA
jgi:fatty acid desaturase